jgi:hypothetical protein
MCGFLAEKIAIKNKYAKFKRKIGTEIKIRKISG